MNTTKMLTTVTTVVTALVLTGAAHAHIPFKDGHRTATQLARTLNNTYDWKWVKCAYKSIAPGISKHVLCTGYYKYEENTYDRANLTVHKTAPKKGYAVICVTNVGCHRDVVLHESGRLSGSDSLGVGRV